MANVDKSTKLQELRAAIEYLSICIDKEETTEDKADEIVAVSEILLRKVYNLYPDIARVFD